MEKESSRNKSLCFKNAQVPEEAESASAALLRGKAQGNPFLPPPPRSVHFHTQKMLTGLWL